MSILVTGGTGFIGSHTCVELLNAGYDVIVMDNLYNSKEECINRIKKITGKDLKFYKADMLDMDSINKIFNENKIDGVIHFAGYKAVGESVHKPLEYYHNNLTGTFNICNAMVKAGCKNIVFSSSATVYGVNNPPPFIENMPTSATNPYGSTKVIIENFLTDLYVADNDWSIALLRYFNPIGAHESGLIGENPNGIPNNLVPYIAQVAIGKLPQLSIYGNDYPTPDGTCLRDYIHVVDLALGHIKALEYNKNHKGVEAINLGKGRAESVLEVVSAYSKACGKEIPYKIAERRAGDIPEMCAGIEKAKNLLNWQATMGIEKMCEDSWNFTVKNPKGM